MCQKAIEDDVIAKLKDNLPDDLDQIYKRTINRIFLSGTTARSIAVKAISWILYMQEPMTPPALLAALATASDSALQVTQVLDVCSNLIVLDTKCNVIAFHTSRSWSSLARTFYLDLSLYTGF